VTNRAPEEPRLKPVSAPGRLGISWLSARSLIVGASLTIAALFTALFFMLREHPLPRRRVDLPLSTDRTAEITTVQERLKSNPQDLSALVELGTLLFEKGKDSYVDAISDLEEARDLGALDTRIFYCLGIMYQEEGLYPFALTEYQRFLRHYPEDKEIRMSLAKLYYRMGMFPEAAGEYDRLKFSNPNDPLIEENLGLSLWGAKQMDRALTSFNQLKSVGGDFGRRAEFYIGQIALEAGRFQEAADRFSACALGGTPLQGVADDKLFTGLGMALQKLGRYEEARNAWENVLRALPKDPKAKAALRETERKIAAAKRAKKK
jgi:tetratricopeptide (TPR) repeat protein